MGSYQLRVLIIGNDEAEYATICRLLSKIEAWTFSFAKEATYQAALTTMLAGNHDLCLINDPLSEGTGLHFLQKAIQAGCQIPLILLTEERNLSLEREVLRSGSTDYLVKSHLTAYMLEHSIQHLLRYQDARADIFGNVYLLEGERKQRHLAETLGRIGLALNSTLNLPELLNLICRESLKFFRVDGAFVWLVQGDELVGFAGYGRHREKFIDIRVPLADPVPLGPRVIREKRPIFINNAPASGNISQRLVKMFQVEAILGVPLMKGEYAFGVLMLIDTQNGHRFNQDDLHLAVVFGNQAAIAVQNAQQFEAEHKQRVLAETLREATVGLTSALDLWQVLDNILTQVEQVVPYDSACIFLLQDQEQTLRAVAIKGFSASETVIGQDYPANNELFQELQQTQQPIYLMAPASDPRFFGWGNTKQIQSWLGIPMIVRGNVIGYITFDSYKLAAYDQAEIALAQTFANHAAIAIQNARLYAKIQQYAVELESLVAHLPTGVVLLDADQRVVLANESAQRLIGLIIPPETGDTLQQSGHYTIESILEAASITAPVTMEMEGLSNQVVEVTANPITAGAEAGGWTLVIRDVTEERRTQKLIQQQERMAAVGQLAAGIAHDFNNILTSMIGFAELLYLDPMLSATARGDVERVIKQGQRAAHLVRQILDFSRRTISDRQPLNLLPLVKEVIKLLERTLPEDIRIILEASQDEYQIKADLIQLQQVITNLAVNARDAMPMGGRLYFRLSNFSLEPGAEAPCPGMAPGEWVRLIIADTGMGILPEHLNKIFEPFFTTKEVGQGTGLGLAQVYGIMQQHEGCIDVKSQVNVGTSFILYFPAIISPSKPFILPASATIPLGNQELLLLVEDNTDVLAAMTAMLKYLGYQVLTATNGDEALSLFNQRRREVALVLTDMTMPGMGGAALIPALQKQNPTIKVIVLTGYPLDMETERPLPEGISGWLQKPPRLQQLAYLVRKTLKVDRKSRSGYTNPEKTNL